MCRQWIRRLKFRFIVGVTGEYSTGLQQVYESLAILKFSLDFSNSPTDIQKQDKPVPSV